MDGSLSLGSFTLLIKLCYFVTVFTLGGIVLSIINGNPIQEWIAQAFLGFSIALLLRRTHEVRAAKKRSL